MPVVSKGHIILIMTVIGLRNNIMSGLGRNSPCPCGSGKKYKKCHMNNRAQVGVVRKAYNVGKDDDFYARFIMGHGNIRDCVYGNDKRLEYDKSFNPVFQNLVEMKIVKDKCASIISKHLENIKTGLDGKYHGSQIDVKDPIDDELNILFKDFFIRGQMAIGALIKHSIYMGSNIGFFFSETEKKFRSGLKNFVLKEEDDRYKALNNFITNHKMAWYLSFREIRRQIEHEGWSLPELKYSLDDSMIVQVHLPVSPGQSIEEILENYWKSMILFCEEIVVFLLGLKLKDPMVIVYLPEDRRDPNVPVRYIVSHKDLLGVLLQCG